MILQTAWFSTACRITYMQGFACLYSQHLGGWRKISSSQTKPTATTTKNPECVTASLTSSDSKEICILWNNQALCILKSHVYQRLQQRLENVLYWGLSSVLEYLHSMYKIQLTLQKEEKNILSLETFNFLLKLSLRNFCINLPRSWILFLP